jgi:hypothetical protein
MRLDGHPAMMDFPLPSRERLVEGLALATGVPDRQITLIERTPVLEGTVAKELLTYATPAGTTQVLCKYGFASQEHSRPGRRGVAFEGDVYRRFVLPSRLPAPRFVGLFAVDDDLTVLVIEYLQGAVRLSEAPISAVVRAAGWLGAFHRRWGDVGAHDYGLDLHDAALARLWADRAQEFAAIAGTARPWLRDVCEAIVESGDRLTAGPLALLHGEFTVHNVLDRDGVTYPVDWEGASIGAGEIDLAMLIERWDRDIQNACIREYCSARWLGRHVPDIRKGLAFAGAYVNLRWLADRESAARKPELSWRFDELLRSARASCLL